MRKTTYDKLQIDKVYCNSCGTYIKKEQTNYRYLKSDGTTSKCSYCEWIERNEIPTIGGYKRADIEKVVKYLLYNKTSFANDVASIIGVDISKAIELMQSIKINNRKLLVKCECDNCHKNMELNISVYMQNQNHYCSKDCYYDHKKITSLGENNHNYKRIKTNCSCCGKELLVIPFDYKQRNQNGENHNFCGSECYWKFRSMHYVGENHHLYGKKLDDASKERLAISLLNRMKSSDRLNTSIQMTVDGILKYLGIHFEREYVISHYSVDNYLDEYNLAIEVMGDYWHSSPIKYSEHGRKINEIQYKGIKKDKAKNTFLNNNGVSVLYLWENDIKKTPDLCLELIKRFVMKDGDIEDYNSFNWSINDGKITLNSVIITPYFLCCNEKYKALLKAS